MTDARARELGDFLRHKRGTLSPSEIGIETSGRRRTPGLRREELCLLSGVGLTWYTWLEQGRKIQPSVQVIDALARTLRLTDAEHDYVRLLAALPPSRQPDDSVVDLPEHVQHVLDAFTSSPAFAITRAWDIIGWNRLYSRFFIGLDDLAPEERNLLWLLWTHSGVRALLADWETDVRRFTATFHASVGEQLHSAPVASLVARLQAEAPAFASVWRNHDIERFATRTRDFQHPVVGQLTLEQHQLVLEDVPGVQVVVYTAARGSASERRLGRMAA